MSTPVEKIKERLGIEEVAGWYIKLEKAGKNLKAKCPFHNEKTPSFYVSPDRGSFYCFGCGAKGDIFSFVEQFEGLDFMGALRLLADRAGVPLVFEKQETKSQKERLYMIMESATKFFEDQLPKSHEAGDYLKKRGLHEKTISDFRIGYAPNEWRLLGSHLKSQKYSETEIELAGLTKRPEPEQGSQQAGQLAQKSPYDRFRGRVMFPISDSSGRVIGFSGRILVDDNKSAKYINSPDTPLYNKSNVLYGIDKAKQDIRQKNYSILVEGQMDLILSHQSGIKNTVAVSGTALSDSLTSKENVVNNLGMVKRLSSNVILAFDSDAAGRKAAMRSAGIALTLGMDVKIADLPEGKDPADIVSSNPEEWKNVLRKAKPVVEFQLEAVLKDIKNKKIDARKIPPLLRQSVLPFILLIEGSMEKSHFIKMIHEKTGLPERAVQDDLNLLAKKNREKNIEQGKVQNKDTANQDRQQSSPSAIISGNRESSRLDRISRKLFGLLSYLELDGNSAAMASDIRSSLKMIAGEERYSNLIREIQPLKDELILEAEVFFGGRSNTDNLKQYGNELLLNLEEDILRQDLADAMAEISRLEKDKAGQTEILKNDLMKKCQSLAMRLSEISKRRNL